MEANGIQPVDDRPGAPWKQYLDRFSSPWFKTLLFPLWIYLQSFGVLVQLHFYFLSVDEDCPRCREGGGEDGSPMTMPGVGKCKWNCRNNALHCLWNDFTAPGPTACSSLAEHIFRCSASHLSAPTAPLQCGGQGKPLHRTLSRV